MIANGRLIPITTKGGGYINGRFVAGTQERGAAVQCNYRCNTSDTVRYQDDNGYHTARFVVYVEGVSFCCDTVELADKGGAALGTFQIRNIERLHTVKMTKLLL